MGRRVVALPGARPRAGRLGAARRRSLRGRLRRRAVGRTRGPRLGRHRDPGRDRPPDRRADPEAAAGGVMTEAPLLEMRGITKAFLGSVVLSEVDLTCVAGEVHAVV